MNLENYVYGSWIPGHDNFRTCYNAVTGAEIGKASTVGVDMNQVLEYGRKCGKSLRTLSFHHRARMLKALALHLTSQKEKFYEISYKTGATKIDSWIDIEGGIGNLFVMSSKGRREMPDDVLFVDGKPELLSKDNSFMGHHIFIPKEGVALHINAFNFPVWGMLEKFAVNFLAGMPAVVKPATATCFLTEAVVREIVASKILPEGSLQLLCGGAGDIMNHLTSQDVVTFTGSAETGQMLKGHEQIIKESVPFTMEADSLNCTILGEDATPDSAEFALFVKEVVKEMTVKAGQKCTAIRRIIVPENLMDDVGAAISEKLKKITIGDPKEEGVRMGSLASRDQVTEVNEKIALLKKSCETVYENLDFELIGGSKEKGAFVAPTLLRCQDALNESAPHDIEAFGPVSTLMAYKTVEEAAMLAKKGKGSLVASIVTKDTKFARNMTLNMGAYHGRLYFLNQTNAKSGTGHGSPLPQLVHGGPGRAGGGEEMGGLRGVFHYMQRTAIQGTPTTISAITGVYQPGSEVQETEKHPFRYHFDELEIGMSLLTHKRTITETDIVNFANVSWDHFYAHTDDTSFEGTFFEKRVAHGYFVIAAAAGLFVDPGKGPVLANYGLDELRFTKPAYAGTTMQVRLTVKEKIDQEVKGDDAPRGVVKWQVEVLDEEQETLALGTILTLVAKS